MPGNLIRLKHITRDMVRAEPHTLWVFGDNMARKGLGGQAAAMRGEPNAVGVPTKWAPTNEPAAFFRDTDLDDLAVHGAIDAAFRTLRRALEEGRAVVIPQDGLGTGLARLPQRAPRIAAYIEALIRELHLIASGVDLPAQSGSRPPPSVVVTVEAGGGAGPGIVITAAEWVANRGRVLQRIADAIEQERRAIQGAGAKGGVPG